MQPWKLLEEFHTSHAIHQCTGFTTTYSYSGYTLHKQQRMYKQSIRTHVMTEYQGRSLRGTVFFFHHCLTHSPQRSPHVAIVHRHIQPIPCQIGLEFLLHMWQSTYNIHHHQCYPLGALPAFVLPLAVAVFHS